jgi:hypothetical protein
LIGAGGNVHDMIAEDREVGFDTSGALSARGKSLRGIELGDSQSKDGHGGNGASEPKTFLRVNN